jgi:hypothetical protein
MKWLFLTAAALVAVASSPAKAEAKYPQVYKFMTNIAGQARGNAYFRCDYTSRTCERGQAWGMGNRVFEIVSDEDRKTVLGHGACHVNPDSWVCWNLDTGYYVGVINATQREGEMKVDDKYDWPRPFW